MRTYQSYFGISTGKWVGLENFYAISLRKKRKGLLQYGGNTHISISSYNTYYDVILLAKKGNSNLLLFTSKVKKDSEIFANKWSETLNLVNKEYF